MSRRKTYCPPARGIIAAISAAVAAPQTVMSPATAHAASNQPAVPTSRADSAEVMKMPEPIIEPTTIIVASIVPSSRTSELPEVLSLVVSVLTGRHVFLLSHKRLYIRDRVVDVVATPVRQR